jgi:hypothetical protein
MVYCDQGLGLDVHKGLGTARDAVRVKFADVTLALSLIEASWLAANLGRVIRVA